MVCQGAGIDNTAVISRFWCGRGRTGGISRCGWRGGGSSRSCGSDWIIACHEAPLSGFLNRFNPLSVAPGKSCWGKNPANSGAYFCVVRTTSMYYSSTSFFDLRTYAHAHLKIMDLEKELDGWTDQFHKGGHDVFDKALHWKLYDILSGTEMRSLYPYFQPLDENQGPVARYQGREVIMLGSNNYLGLTTHPKVREASIERSEERRVGK